MLTAQELVDLADLKIGKGINIADTYYDIDDYIEIVYYGEIPAIRIGDEDNWYLLFLLDIMDYKDKLSEYNLKRNNYYVSVREIYEILKQAE